MTANTSKINANVTTVRSWNSQTRRHDFTFTFKFDSKETYLEFRNEWRKEYAELSASIRDTKKQIRETQRAGNYAGSLQAYLRQEKDEARRLNAMRVASKLEAKRQYQAQKAAAAV